MSGFIETDSPAITRLNRLITLGWGDHPQGEIPPDVLSGESNASPAKQYKITNTDDPPRMSKAQLERHAQRMRERRSNKRSLHQSEAARRAWIERRRRQQATI